jgi:hypothetical protein
MVEMQEKGIVQLKGDIDQTLGDMHAIHTHICNGDGKKYHEGLHGNYAKNAFIYTENISSSTTYLIPLVSKQTSGTGIYSTLVSFFGDRMAKNLRCAI